ncbi:MAG: hypothetical protein PUP92_36385 [Rhizonema sp. PD38]|nr:hypothetical protein [Rhizonema sp. PD38]
MQVTFEPDMHSILGLETTTADNYENQRRKSAEKKRMKMCLIYRDTNQL